MLRQKVKSKKNKKIYLVLAIVLIVGAGVIAFFVHRSSTDKKPATTASQLTKGEVNTGSGKSSDKSDKSGSSGTSGLGSQTSDDKNEAGDQPSTNATLIAPTGTFVSNHHPNLGGSPAPNEEQSTCNTTPGATCQISFTYNGITKSLPAQTADSGGATYWTWNLQDIGLTEGSWQIQATAHLNGKTLTGSDALKLEVQP